MDAPSIKGWKIYTPLPGTKAIDELKRVYFQIAPFRGDHSGQLTKINERLKQAVGFIKDEQLPSIGWKTWALAGIFRAAPGESGRIKILLPFMTEQSGQKIFEQGLFVYTHGLVVEPDVEKVLNNLATIFDEKTKESRQI